MVKIVKIDKKSEIPLVGAVMFGCIDRGTNIIQVRPTTICNLKCIFCSTNANNPEVHPVEYIVEPDYLLQYIKEIVKFKGNSIILLDSVGDSTTYPDLIELIKGISKIKEVKKIIMESNGVLLDKKLISNLKKAGLNQINLSVHSLDKDLAKKLCGISSYNIDKIIEAAKEITKNKIELVLTPVWIPKINDQDIIDLIKFSKEINAKIGIQKYEVHRYGRKIKTKRMNWYKFYKQLKEWEKEFDISLKMNPKELGIEKRKSLPKVFRKNEKTNVKIKAPGWIKNQMIGVAKNRSIAIINCNGEIDKTIRVKILRDKDNIYLAEPI